MYNHSVAVIDRHMTVITDKVSGLDVFNCHAVSPSALSAGIGVSADETVLQEHMVGEM